MARRVPLKKPNGYGCIKKLSGNRRRKFAVYITTGYDDNGRQMQAPIGYYETYQEADIALAKYNDDPYYINARNTTFGEIYNILYETKFSKLKPSAKTVYTTAYAKCAPIKDMKIRSIKAAHMRNIVSMYRDKSASTQNNISCRQAYHRDASCHALHWDAHIRTS